MPWKRSARCEERHPHTVHPPERELCNLILGGNVRKLALLFTFAKKGVREKEKERERGVY